MERKNKNYYIPASEARKLADEGELLEKRVFKLIREAALDGCTSFSYGGLQGISQVALNMVIESLIYFGYTANYDSASHELSISW